MAFDRSDIVVCARCLTNVSEIVGSRYETDTVTIMVSNDTFVVLPINSAFYDIAVIWNFRSFRKLVRSRYIKNSQSRIDTDAVCCNVSIM